MSRQYFSINREIFDIDFTSKSGAYDLQSRISSLVNGTLTRQMELLLEKNIPEAFLYKINTLTVEVGTVNIDNLEEELPQKFMEAFALVLEEQIRRQQSGLGGDNIQVLPTDHSLIDLMDYFLYTGHLPWWAVKNESFTPSVAMEEMLHKNPAALRAIILRAGQFEHVRRRLVRQFSKEQIREVIRILEPGEAAYIFGFEEKVIEVKNTDGLVKAEEKEFEQALTYFILTYLIVERGGTFNRKEFAKSVLGQIAFNFNMQYVELLHVFYSALETLETEGENYKYALKLLIQELAAEAYEIPEWREIASAKMKKNISPDDSGRDINIIRQYLVSGTLPFWISVKEGEEESIRALLFRLISTVPDTFQLMLSQLSWNRDIADRLFILLGPDKTREYLKILYGNRAETIVKIAATFSLLHKTKQTWMVTEQVFEEAVWHSVLAATLLSPINLVDDKQLIRLLLKGISAHLQAPLLAVVQRIQTGVKVLFNVDLMQMRHLDLINEVLGETQGVNEMSVMVNKTEQLKDHDLTESLFSTEAQLLSHLLRFFLQYGSLPWWGRSHAGKSPAMLFQQLNAKSPVEAQLVFRFAGASSQLRKRWLQSLGTESFLLMLQQVDTSGMVSKAYQLQLDLFAVITSSLDKTNVDAIKSEWVIADISWQLFHAGLYQSFSLTDFYLKNFFSGVQLLDIEPVLLLQEWERWLALPDNIETPAGSVLHVLSKKYSRPRVVQSGMPLDELNKVSPHIWHSLINIGVQAEADSRYASVAELLKMTDGNTKEQIAAYFIGVLKSYLIAGFLPPFFKPTDEHSRIIFFRQLVEIVYTIHPLQLVKLLSATEVNSFRVLEITSLYKLAEGGDAGDIALLMLPVRNKMQSFIRLQTTDEIKIQGKREQEVFVEDMLMAFSGKQGTVADIDKPGIIYHMLRYYLTWNRLPEALMKTVMISGDAVIRHFIRHLFSIDQHKVVQLLQENTSLPSAIMSLYAILTSSNTNEDKKILKLLNNYLEKDTAKDKSIISLPEFLDQIDMPAFSSSGEWMEQTALETAISSGSLKESLKQKKVWVSYLSEKGGRLYDEVLVLYKNELHSTFQEHTFYLENLLNAAFTDTLLRDKALIVLRYFNLQSAVQGLRFRNKEEYFSLFLSYFTHTMPNSTHAIEQLYNKEAEKKDAQETGLLPILAAQVNRIKDIELASDSFNKFYEDRDVSLTSRDRSLEQQKITESLEKEWKAAKEKERILEAEEAALKQKEKKTKLFIPNAGLVILHPFFSTYFTRLGLMEAGVFNNDEAKERAVLLLQYLATGRNKFDEYELILNKLLCGMPIEQPVAFDIEPTDSEIALTEELFEVLKQRWEKVKNSTVEGIRASFIIREGALEFIEDQWNLRVEQRGYDMLLQTLPWAFGFIKTNWMKQILTVEWI